MLLKKDLNRKIESKNKPCKHNKKKFTKKRSFRNKENKNLENTTQISVGKLATLIDKSNLPQKKKIQGQNKKITFGVKDIKSIFVSKEDFSYKRPNSIQNLEKKIPNLRKARFSKGKKSTPEKVYSNQNNFSRHAPMQNLEKGPILKKRNSLSGPNPQPEYCKNLKKEKFKRVKKKTILLMRSEFSQMKKSFTVYQEIEVFGKNSSKFLKMTQPTEIDNDVISDDEMVEDDVVERTEIFREALRRYSFRRE